MLPIQRGAIKLKQILQLIKSKEANTMNENWYKLNEGDIVKSNTALVFDGKFSDLNYKRLIVVDIDLTMNAYSLYQKALKKTIKAGIQRIDEQIDKGYIDVIKKA
jgi:hypothetical protein